MIDTSKFNLVVRPDFSMVAIPRECYPLLSRKGISPAPCEYMDLVYYTCKRDYNRPCPHMDADRLCQKGKRKNNRAEDGFTLAPRSRVKIRSAVNALWLGNPRSRQTMRFCTFTFPELPASMQQLPLVEQDQALYKIFKRFLRNEYQNHGLKKYVWVNERQEESRNTLHFHTVFMYEKLPNYENINIRFINLLRRNGFDIYSYGFRLDCYASRRRELDKLLNQLDYKAVKMVDRKFQEPTVDEKGIPTTITKSVFFQPFDGDKIATNIIQVGYYLSKYVSKDDSNVKVFCTRWHCSRGLFSKTDKASIFAEFDDAQLLEIYKDISTGVKQKGGGHVNEKELKPTQFEIFVNDKKYTCWHWLPPFRKWTMDKEIHNYFKEKFNFYLT